MVEWNENCNIMDPPQLVKGEAWCKLAVHACVHNLKGQDHNSEPVSK